MKLYYSKISNPEEWSECGEIIMKKTYADICIERADKASKEPWKQYQNGDAPWPDGIQDRDGNEVIGSTISYEQTGVYLKENAEFIAKARSDVPELARRLKRAVNYMRKLNDPVCNKIADELEAMPEGG
jgi:hypothetical protein